MFVWRMEGVRHRLGVLATMAAAAVVPAAGLHVAGAREAQLSPELHLALVALGAAVAGAASVALSVAAYRRRDGATILLSTAFSTMTALLLLHGLSTPGVIVGPNGVIAMAGAASLPVGGALLALSAIPQLRRPRSVRRLAVLQAALAATVFLLGGLGMAFPSLVPAVPKAASTPAIVLLVIGLLFYALLAGRAARTYWLTQRPADLLVAVGCVWLGGSLFPQLVFGPGNVGFYLGHGLEILGIAAIGVPAVLDLFRGGASRPLVGDLSACELVRAEEEYLGPRVRSLLLDLERKDRSTERHTRRVAMLAVQVGEQMRLPAPTLRHLAVGGLMHDIGKLSVPRAVLCKPGALTDAEFGEIRRHPAAGVSLLRELGGFADEVLRLVHEHHERLDGSGYPRGTAGPQIGIGPRILAVCDVYDALTSDRVYRGAWEEPEALALLREGAGVQFDAACVHALEKVLAAAPARVAVRSA